MFPFMAIATGLCEDNMAVPIRQGSITDMAFALSKSDHNALASLLDNFQLETHHQIAVLVIPSLNGQSIESFSFRVANAWGIGLKGWNDGILVTIAVREGGIRIELGEGMEHYISNSMAKDVIDHDMMPAFRQGDITGSLRAGLQHLMLEARAYKISGP
jgi:uncharacterized protein